jgi:hypothetical protein
VWGRVRVISKCIVSGKDVRRRKNQNAKITNSATLACLNILYFLSYILISKQFIFDSIRCILKLVGFDGAGIYRGGFENYIPLY